jgi:CysZ protein
MNELGRGVHDVGRGFRFLGAHPRLWGWVIAPAVLTALLLIALVIAALRFRAQAVTSITAHLPTWLEGVASWGLSLVLMTALAAGAVLVFVALAGLIAGPFCERLSEAVEQQLTGRASPPSSLAQLALELVTGIGHSLRRVAGAVLAALALLALSFLPVVGSVAAVVIGGWLAASGAAYDCYDAVLARRALSYRDKLGFLRAHRGRSLGLGAAVTGLLLVPGVNLIALGIGAVGATLAAHELAGGASAARGR